MTALPPNHTTKVSGLDFGKVLPNATEQGTLRYLISDEGKQTKMLPSFSPGHGNKGLRKNKQTKNHRHRPQDGDCQRGRGWRELDEG